VLGATGHSCFLPPLEAQRAFNDGTVYREFFERPEGASLLAGGTPVATGGIDLQSSVNFPVDCSGRAGGQAGRLIAVLTHGWNAVLMLFGGKSPRSDIDHQHWPGANS
jgi:hypothetical protein